MKLLKTSRTRLIQLTASLLVSGLATTAMAEDKDPRFTLTLGGSLIDFNAGIQASSKQFGAGTEIDFEDDLGYDDSDSLGRFQFRWDINPRHSLGLTYLPVSRSATRNVLKDLEYEDQTIGAGAFVNSEVKTNIYDIEYHWNFLKRDRHTLGLTAGIHWMDISFDLDAFGEITDKNNNVTVINGSYSTTEDIDAPLPLIGLNYRYDPTDQWRLIAGFRWLDVTIDDYAGDILLANVAAEYYFTRNWGVGTSIGSFDMNVDADTSDLLGSFEWEYSGLAVYLIARF